eukprot:gene8250-16968_t
MSNFCSARSTSSTTYYFYHYYGYYNLISMQLLNLLLSLKILLLVYILIIIYGNSATTNPWTMDSLSVFENELCLENKATWKAAGHNRWDIATWCKINSPLHYFLVDVAMAYVKNQCLNSQLSIVTNADNCYSPNYFKAILLHVDKYDVILNSMINHHEIMHILPKYQHVDLGAVAVSIPFLRKTGINFNNSIPDPTHAGYFHSLD